MPIDPRWFTTPAGAVVGMALTKAIMRDPTRLQYAIGGGVGGTAGFAGGTYVKHALPSYKKELAESEAQAKQEAALAAGKTLEQVPGKERQSRDFIARVAADPRMLLGDPSDDEQGLVRQLTTDGKLRLTNDLEVSEPLFNKGLKAYAPTLGRIDLGMDTPMYRRSKDTLRKAVADYILKRGEDVAGTDKALTPQQISLLNEIRQKADSPSPDTWKQSLMGVGEKVLAGPVGSMDAVARPLGLLAKHLVPE